MDRRDDETGEIAWPGFVDILSAVIIMFIFFVMITSIVMFVLNVEHQKSMTEQNEQRVQEMVSEELQAVLEQIKDGEITLEDIKKSANNQEKVDILSEDNEKLTTEKLELEFELDRLGGAIEQIRADFSYNEEQDMVVSDGFFVILFSFNDITVSDETVDAISAYLDVNLPDDNADGYEIRILACDNPNAPTITVSRELSLARALNIRNAFLDKNIDSEAISFFYAQPHQIEDSYNWVKIGVIKK